MSEPGQLALRKERSLVLLLAAVQFINILDFVMVMPLGPFFAGALDVPESHLGYVGGAYTAAAAVAGLVASTFLDRFDRRWALAVCLAGLSVGTAAGGIATGLGSLIAARVVAGSFGGPATALALAAVSDVVPAQRRGRAMGTLMAAFSVASILGVPAGLYLAELTSWRGPFFFVALLGFGVAVLAAKWLPSMRGHVANGQGVGAKQLLSRPIVQLSFVMTAVVMMAGFSIIPNIAAYVQSNLGFPQTSLKWGYFIGGFFSFATMKLGGLWVDRFGSFRVGAVASGFLIGVLFIYFYRPLGWPVLLFFALFMTALGLRNVAYNTLTSKVPAAPERARFQALQSSVQHFASAAGAFLSSRLLWEVPKLGADGKALLDARGAALTRLAGMDRVALISMGLTLVLPWFLWTVEKSLKPAMTK